MNYEKYLETFTSQAAYSGIKKKYKVILENMDQGVYIWGTKRLGKFVEKQCKKNGIKIKGFIDNRMENSADNNIFLPSVVKKDDIIIIASISYWEIEQQIKSSELTENYLYYEILAKADERFEIYYAGFDGLFEDIERNKRKYIDILSVCEDNASYEVLGNVLMYRMTLDDSYIEKAYNLSILSGEQDFDKLIIDKLDNSSTFYDVGGYDGTTTRKYLELFPKARKIYFFEPDKKEMRVARERLKKYKQIEFINAVVGEKRENCYLKAIGDGASMVSDEKDYDYKSAQIVLDDYIQDGNSYIKMDIEGYEVKALLGMKKAIKEWSPILGISLYHIPGDIYKIPGVIVGYNKKYKLYVRHYTLSYADTVGYFI